jgi:uncharacterized membrane protein YhaH (DUF805 family)
MDYGSSSSGALETGILAGGVLFFVFLYLALVVLYHAMYWKLFTKAGYPGWASLVPFYNTYCMMEMAGKPGWWVLLMLIPLINFVVGIIWIIDFCRAFGQGGGFALGMYLLPILFVPILAFGDAKYLGPPQHISGG